MVPADLYERYLADSPGTAPARAAETRLNRRARNEAMAFPSRRPRHVPRRRIVLHIGGTKTGSTFLQTLMDESRPALLRAGLWYPEIGLFEQRSGRAKQAGHARFLAAALEGDPSFRRYVDTSLATLGNRVETVILSSEAFFLHRDAARLADYFHGHDVEVVAYFRRQDSWANAQYCEFAAGGAIGRISENFQDWLKRGEVQRWLDPMRVLGPWADRLGSRRVHLRPYEREAWPDGDILADFISTTGLDILRDCKRPSPDKGNAFLLDHAAVEAIRRYNALAWPDRSAYLAFVAEASLALDRIRRARRRPLVKPQLVDRITARGLLARAEGSNGRAAVTLAALPSGRLFGAAPLSAPTVPGRIDEESAAAIAAALSHHATATDLAAARRIEGDPAIRAALSARAHRPARVAPD